VVELENKLEDMEEETGETIAIETTPKLGGHNDDAISEDAGAEESFMSESIYQKLPSPRSRKHRTISTPLRIPAEKPSSGSNYNYQKSDQWLFCTSISSPEQSSRKSKPTMT
jgi:hypothetical protein